MTAARKAELRRTVLARRDALAPEERARRSAAIFATIGGLEAYRGARTVLAYHAFGSEPATGPFLSAVLAAGKTLVLPRVDRAARVLRLHRVGDPEAELEPGVWGIREPRPAVCPAIAVAEVDFVLVPGVVFDARGGRIGYGGGYYDRLLRGGPSRPHLVAAAFDVQVVPEVPMGPEDVRVDHVVTETQVHPN